MKKKKSSRTFSIGLLLVIASTLLIAATIAGRAQYSAAIQGSGADSALPVANYEAAEPVDPIERAKRRAKNNRYDRQSSEVIKEAPYPLEAIWSSYWSRGLPSIPVLQSDAIIIGEVVDAQAHLSNDKTGVYSEFVIRLEEILKESDGKLAISLANSQVISAERFGGAVRFPSGVVQKYKTQFQVCLGRGDVICCFLRSLIKKGNSLY